MNRPWATWKPTAAQAATATRFAAALGFTGVKPGSTPGRFAIRIAGGGRPSILQVPISSEGSITSQPTITEFVRVAASQLGAPGNTEPQTLPEELANLQEDLRRLAHTAETAFGDQHLYQAADALLAYAEWVRGGRPGGGLHSEAQVDFMAQPFPTHDEDSTHG